MTVYKITFQVEAETVPEAIAKLKNEQDVLKYVVSVFQVREQQPAQSGWATTSSPSCLVRKSKLVCLRLLPTDTGGKQQTRK